jgi:hypothetical protein
MSSSCSIKEHSDCPPRGVELPRRLSRAFRLALTVVVAVVCCYVAYGFGRWWAESRRAGHRPASSTPEAADLNPLAGALPLAGQWAFDELDWSLKSLLVDARELDAQFESIAAAPPTTTATELPSEFIGAVKALQIQPIKKMGNLVYRLDRRDIKVQLITRDVAGQSKNVAFSIAYPHGGDKWQLFAFTPHRTACANSNADSHLLPLPPSAHRNGGRFGDDGRPLLEFISVDANATQLLTAWKDVGWEVRPSGLAGAADFSFLCARGKEVIYAWSADPADSLHNLMLVRTLAPLDTSP